MYGNARAYIHQLFLFILFFVRNIVIQNPIIKLIIMVYSVIFVLQITCLTAVLLILLLVTFTNKGTNVGIARKNPIRPILDINLNGSFFKFIENITGNSLLINQNNTRIKSVQLLIPMGFLDSLCSIK